MDEEENCDLAGKENMPADDSQSTYCESQEVEATTPQNVFPESPSYDLLDTDCIKQDEDKMQDCSIINDSIASEENNKRKLADDETGREFKIKKGEMYTGAGEAGRGETSVDLNDSQALHLRLSASWSDTEPMRLPPPGPPGPPAPRRSDLDTTDTASPGPRSPDAPVSLAHKLITKLSNGDSSTPSEGAGGGGAGGGGEPADDTPSTISPLRPAPARFPLATPKDPVFDVHIGRDEDGEFLSMYIVRTDHELGSDMAKEFNRFSKRFTMDPYLADVSKSSSPSSVLSGWGAGAAGAAGARGSLASATSSSVSGGSRTSDGAFAVPRPPHTAHAAHLHTNIKGFAGLLVKIREIFGVCPESAESRGGEGCEGAGGATSLSNGPGSAARHNCVASPDEVSAQRATPRSSLKKTKGRGRRALGTRARRGALYTQHEEPDTTHTLTPDPVDTNTTGTPATPRTPSRRGRKPRAQSPRPAAPAPAPPAPVARSPPRGHPPGTLVLARWIDKRYYSGRVQNLMDNKYVIEFDDGQVKTLSEEFIIFGDMQALPLRGQSVYVMVDEHQNYEPGLVLQVDCGDGGALYKCTTDCGEDVCVTAAELYMTEDQAVSLLEAGGCGGGGGTPRRRLERDLHLDNIVHGARRRVRSPDTPRASTSGLSVGVSPGARRRPASDSSEVSESGAPAPALAPAPAHHHVAGVEPELHHTPRKIPGLTAGPLQLKGLARRNVTKKHSKLRQFDTDEETSARLGPLPSPGADIFTNMHFLLTCSGDCDMRATGRTVKKRSLESEGDTTGTGGSEREDAEFARAPFHKERLRAQLESGGGTVHAHLHLVPPDCRQRTLLVAPRPCRTAKYLQCLAGGVRAVSHDWVVASCQAGAPRDTDAFLLPAGWSVLERRFITWRERGSGAGLRGCAVAVWGEGDTFVRFWSEVCGLAGMEAREVWEAGGAGVSGGLAGAVALLTEAECPTAIQNAAVLERVPLVSPLWLWQCLVLGRTLSPRAHPHFAFSYSDPD